MDAVSANLQNSLRELLDVEAIELRLDALEPRLKALEARQQPLLDKLAAARRENGVLWEKFGAIRRIVDILQSDAGPLSHRVIRDHIDAIQVILQGPT